MVLLIAAIALTPLMLGCVRCLSGWARGLCALGVLGVGLGLGALWGATRDRHLADRLCGPTGVAADDYLNTACQGYADWHDYRSHGNTDGNTGRK